MALNTLGKRDWLLIGGLIILGAGMIGACTHPTERPTPVVETTPVVVKPKEGISKETISPEPGLETESISQPSPPEESEKIEEECYKDPREALDRFLSYLHNGQYDKAAKLYGSDYPFEGTHLSPSEMEPNERIKFKAKFLEDFCKGHATCLEHKIVSEEIISEDEVSFSVQFYEENGEVFELAMPPWVEEERYATKFSFKVKKNGDCYESMSFPPSGP
jgi:hypothetical protein